MDGLIYSHEGGDAKVNTFRAIDKEVGKNDDAIKVDWMRMRGSVLKLM
jgi:hypothetical protein